MSQVTVEQAARELEVALSGYDSARGEAARHRNLETDALNRLNAAQKAFDAAVAALRKTAPLGSDWQR